MKDLRLQELGKHFPSCLSKTRNLQFSPFDLPINWQVRLKDNIPLTVHSFEALATVLAAASIR